MQKSRFFTFWVGYPLKLKFGISNISVLKVVFPVISFVIVCHLAMVINCANFGFDWSRGFQSADPENWPIIESLHLLYNIVLHYRAAMWCVRFQVNRIKSIHPLCRHPLWRKCIRSKARPRLPIMITLKELCFFQHYNINNEI